MTDPAMVLAAAVLHVALGMPLDVTYTVKWRVHYTAPAPCPPPPPDPYTGQYPPWQPAVLCAKLIDEDRSRYISTLPAALRFVQEAAGRTDVSSFKLEVPEVPHG